MYVKTGFFHSHDLPIGSQNSFFVLHKQYDWLLKPTYKLLCSPASQLYRILLIKPLLSSQNERLV